MRVFAEDARPWLERSQGGYDAIMVDAYRQPYIPFYLATREFFELTRERLAPGGLAIVNVGHPEGAQELERVLGRTMAAAFPRVLRYPVEDDQHAAGRRATAPSRRARLRANLASLPAALRPQAREAARELSPRLPAARSTPTIAPRSSGWSTPPCWNTRMSDPGREPAPGW